MTFENQRAQRQVQVERKKPNSCQRLGRLGVRSEWRLIKTPKIYDI